MKRCPFCGGEYSDETELCPTDQSRLEPADKSVKPIEQTIAQEMLANEQSFWKRMTFKEFAALILRIQALWLFFYAFIDATYLSRYANIFSPVSAYASLTASGRLELLMLILRIIVHIAVAVAVIQNAEKILSWLIKDSVSRK